MYRNASNFAALFDQPPFTCTNKLAVMSLIGTLRTLLSYCTRFFSRLQRTKLPSRKPTQDYNLFDIGCDFFCVSSKSFVTVVSLCIFVSCFVRVEKNVKKYGILMTFVRFVIFNRGVLCQDTGKISWNIGKYCFLCRIKEIFGFFFSAHPILHLQCIMTWCLFISNLSKQCVLNNYEVSKNSSMSK